MTLSSTLTACSSMCRTVSTTVPSSSSALLLPISPSRLLLFLVNHRTIFSQKPMLRHRCQHPGPMSFDLSSVDMRCAATPMRFRGLFSITKRSMR